MRSCNKWIQEIVLKIVVEEEGKMKPRRGSEMTPPPQRVCFVMLMSTMCFVWAVAQTSDVEGSSAEALYTDTTLEICKYRTGNLSLFMCEKCRISG